MSLHVRVTAYDGDAVAHQFMMPAGYLDLLPDVTLIHNAVEQVAFDQQWVEKYRPAKGFSWDRLIVEVADRQLEALNPKQSG